MHLRLLASCAVIVLVGCTQQLPVCPDGQFVTSDGKTLTCAALPTKLDVPTCPTGQFLTGTATGLACAMMSGGNMVIIPTCTGSQVLTAANNAFSCVTALTVPTCSGSDVLTSDGTGGIKCVAQSMSPTIPECMSGEALTRTATGFTCVALPTVPTPPTCAMGSVLTSDGTTLSCVAQPIVPTLPPCAGNEVLTTVNGALTCVSQTMFPTIPTCTSGQVLTSTATGVFSCVSPVTLPTCTSGQFLTANGTALSCASVSTASLARYLGNTATNTNGLITRSGTPSGLPAANALCVDQYGAGARMCSSEDMFQAVASGSLVTGTATARAWVFSTTTYDYNSAGTAAQQGLTNNCASYTYPTGDHPWYGTTAQWMASPVNSALFVLSLRHGPFPNGNSCSTQNPIACCR